MPERVYPLDSETLELFALKGTQGGCGTVQIGNANGVKVRRVMQITSDFAKYLLTNLKLSISDVARVFMPSKRHCVALRCLHWTAETSG